MTAEATKARCISVSHMILPSSYWSALRKTCSKWMEEMATIEEATLIFRLPESSLPRKETSLSASLASSKRLTKFS
ncbi:hypothetical protein HNP83_001433 [Rhizobium leguminosarum]|nr:hypothetical protein [Rhizobium leguminosarum]